MFIVKFHAKGHKTTYLGDGKIVSTKKSAMAFGEGLREQFKHLESDHCTLEKLAVSYVAEAVYLNSYIKIGSIIW